MKLKIPDNIRVFISKKYLDWAESLPKFRGGFIAELQGIREHQRRMSDDECKRSRAPEGTNIEFVYFRMIEIFHIEEFDNLKEGLVRLFPNLRGNSINSDFSSDFTRFTSTISGGGFKKLGFIRRESRPFFPTPYREIKDLPPEVNYIEVSIHKMLPSVIFVALDVHLSDLATEHLSRLQSDHYLSRIRFKNLLPWRSVYSHSQEFADSIRAQQICSWFNKLRSEVEKYIRPFLNGFFMQRVDNSLSRLPAIEVFSLKGFPDGTDAFETWRSSSYDWWKSLGFNFSFDLYGDGKALFFASENSETRGYSPYHLIILWDQYLHSIKSGENNREKQNKIIYNTRYDLDAILTCIAVIEFLKSAQKDIEKLRKEVFDSMNHRFFTHYRLSRHIKLNNIVKRENMFLERISMEFKERINLILHEMKPMKDFKITDKKRDDNLCDNLIRSVEFNIDCLKKHLLLITTSFSEYLTTQNMEAMYRLQRSILWLTIIVTVATIVGLTANWNNIQTFFSSVIDQMK